jgi:DNA (cytosine-5)-methyltransferase 1
MVPNLPVGTITTASGHLGSDAKIHPWENRILSPRECADAQTIPRSFEFRGNGGSCSGGLVREVVGEAIPPWFTFLHGLALRSLLNGLAASPHLLTVDDYDIERTDICELDAHQSYRRRLRSSFVGERQQPVPV